MSKIKLTRKQAEALEEVMEDRTKISLISEKANPFISAGRYMCEKSRIVFNEIGLETLIKALYIGYEVEEEFKVGDWVVCEDGYIGEIEFINEVESWANIGYSKDTKERGVCLAATYDLIDIKRHATPEEIAEEKQRRWWAKHGRKVWELKLKDEIRHKESDRRFDVIHVFDNGDINVERTSTNDYEQKEVVTVKRSYISNYYYEVVCFSEDRKDVQA